MGAEIYMGVYFICCLIIFILWIMVLIKSFKKGGVLIGLLGIITCGLVTFIWGWIKHKEAEITKLMLLWTLLWIISIAVFMMVGVSAFQKQLDMLQKQGFDIQSIQKGKSSAKKNKNLARLKKRRAAKSSMTGQKPGVSATGQTKDPNSMAVALWKDGKYTNPNRAIVYLNQAINKYPNFAEAYNNRGNAYRDLKQPQKAIQDYNQAIRIKPQFVKAFSNRGNIYFDQKKYQQAIKDYNQAIKLNPAYTQAYFNRGLAYQELKKIKQACKDFNKACQLGDCDGSNWAKENGICK